MTEHTPGPWTYEKVWGCKEIYAPAIRENAAAAEGDDGGIATTFGYTHGRAVDEEDEANARLIAAAPELLEALEELPLAAFADGPSDAADFKDNAPAFLRAMDLARAALAKTRRPDDDQGREAGR